MPLRHGPSPHMCTSPLPPLAAGCRWRDGSDELQVDSTVQSCSACQSGCQYDATCREYRYGSQQPDWVSYAVSCEHRGG